MAYPQIKASYPQIKTVASTNETDHPQKSAVIHIKKWMIHKKTDSSTKKRNLIPKKEIKIAEKERYPQNFINKKRDHCIFIEQDVILK
ncbi:MAG: hypothetical protein ABGX20_15475 [Bacillus sp. (in: firmicutes)]